MRHLFLAPLGSAFGEALHGVRLAREVVAAGHEVVFLAPAAMQPLIGDSPVTFGRIDLAIGNLDQQIAMTIRKMKCESLVLVDASAVGKVARAFKLDPRAFTHPDVPVVALDCWNLPAEPVMWEYSATATETLPREFHQLARRLVPVPIAPIEVAGGFRALPEIAPRSTEERAALRAELGLGATERLILWPSASWQSAESHTDPALVRLAAALPALILPRLDELGDRVHVIHVGPLPFADAAQLAPRYRFLSQVAPERFEQLVVAADLVIGFNAIATSLGTAIAARTPMLVGTTTLRADTMSRVERALGPMLTPPVRRAIEANLPIAPVHAWPLRLGAILEPTLAGNPLATAIGHADVFDEPSYVDACTSLLFDPYAADAMRQAQDDYHRRVRALPAGHEQLLALLGA